MSLTTTRNSKNYTPPGSSDARLVLVVDDSKLQRRILSSSLNRWGYEVMEAESGMRALEICRERPPELVLSDWVMPGMTGIEFCQKLRIFHSSYVQE